jgi:wyosine [tRNA(Phe)-imidazoG37] synthetase (radical SAM superfamily)
MKTIFGPVPSRRLGRSLGIDVITPKTCSYDCVYCESGRTTHLTLHRQLFVDPTEVIRELEEYFRSHPKGADALTFSSAGEPTLYQALGELLRDIKRRFRGLPLVVLTNGSLLWDAAVRRELLAADRVVPSLDASTDVVFQQINRPHPRLELDTIVAGLQAFRRDYRGQYHLEVMLVAGLNDHPEELRGLAALVNRLEPDRVELNTVVRPPADPDAAGLTAHQMQCAAHYFPPQKAEVIGCFEASPVKRQDASLAERICELLRRRPCTPSEMADCLAVPQEEIQGAVAALERDGVLTPCVLDGRNYFRLAGCQAP